ncbi:MAG: gamma-glutamyltransferase [Propionibacteriales bacterium]|nr:gamma-glutamyltransferase [Propionibacteriales bacterium]
MREPRFLSDLDQAPYNSQRSPLVASGGAVATSQPLAAAAGLRILMDGGNAVDAALAAAICLTVVEPTSNGIGGDLFCQVWDGNRLVGLNGSGRSPAALDHAELLRRGHDQMPPLGWLPVTVPGAPRAWADLHARFGRREFGDLFQPAIRYATDGVPISPIIAAAWSTAFQTFAAQPDELFRPWLETFAPSGRAPRAGELWRSPGHARTLREIAETGADGFYSGRTADEVVSFARRSGGMLTEDDLGRHASEWVEPLRVGYRGYDVWELPPNGQGLAVLIALGILDGLELGKDRDDPREQHLQIDAVKLALADARRYVTDPEHEPVPVDALLDPAHAASRRAVIGERAVEPEPGTVGRGGTVYLSAADADGMMVSLIQSNFQGFGSGVVVPATGIALQNRGVGFVIDDGHPNRLAPRKRPFHTIIPGFLTRGGEGVGPFGVMGGHMQAQGHVQFLTNTIDHGLHPQAALDAPRWRWIEGRRVALEDGPLAADLAEDLARRGHEPYIEPASTPNGVFGRGQAIWRDASSGTYVAGSDKRADGCAIGY